MPIKQADKIRDFLLKNTTKHPHDLVHQCMINYNVSRTTVLRHIQHLIRQNKLTKTGNTKQVTYTLTEALNKSLVTKLTDGFDEYLFFETYLADILKATLNQDAFDICEYVITEMLNNCKDHSRGTSANVITSFKDHVLHCTIEDDGIGLFRTLRSVTSYDDYRDVILELSKGKLTRDPMNHTGEGIFFSSRAVDTFTIKANGFQFFRDNLISDWTLSETPNKKGTCITFEIQQAPQRALTSLFDSYTEEFTFTKTDVLVDLSLQLGERLISRSQAKRVCRRLEQFTHVTLDFKQVEAVGQGFIDQLFRVYQREHPDTIITYINANENVDFMIKRCLASL